MRELGPDTLRIGTGEWEALSRVASVIGSTGKLILEENTCTVDLARYFLEYTQQESCAACLPCRIGTKRLLEIMERVVDGRADVRDLSLLEMLGRAIGPAAKCDLGRMAGRVIANLVAYCRDDFETHLEGRCPGTVEANPGWQTIVGRGA